MVPFFPKLAARLNQKFSKERIDQVHLGYIVAFVIFITLHKLIPYNAYLPQLLDSVLYSIFAIAGALLVAYDFLSGRIPLYSRVTLFMIAFLLICLVSSFVNMRYGLLSNLKTIVWTGIHFFVLFASSRGKTRDQVFREVRLVFTPYSVIWLVGVLLSLGLFITLQGGFITLMDGTRSEYGFIKERLFGAFTDPNVAGVLSLTSIALSVFCLRGKRRKLVKAYHIFNIVCMVLYAILSSSRTTLLAGALAFTVVLTLYLFQRLDRKKLAGFWKRSVCVVCSAVIAAGMVLGSGLIHKQLAYLPAIYEEIVDSNRTEHQLKPIDVNRTDVGDGKDISNLRFKIWSNALDLFKESPIIGTSPRNHLAYAEIYTPNQIIHKKQYSIHNGYLAVLVTTGIAGAAVFLLLAAHAAETLYLGFIAKKTKTKETGYLPLLFILILLAISAVSMMGIVFGNSISEVAFWLVLGYLFTMVPGQFDKPPRFLRKYIKYDQESVGADEAKA